MTADGPADADSVEGKATDMSDRVAIRIYYCRNSVNGRMPVSLAKLGQRPDIALEPVPCSGRTDPRYILKAFESGTSKVCLLACPEGECKLLEGNLRAVRRIDAARELLAEAGIDPLSVRIFQPDNTDPQSFDSAVAEITRFADEVTA